MFLRVDKSALVGIGNRVFRDLRKEQRLNPPKGMKTQFETDSQTCIPIMETSESDSTLILSPFVNPRNSSSVSQ